MTNSEIIAAVERWQTDTRLHPLTCRTCGEVHHERLKPIEKAGHVLLECPYCERCEVNIPDVVLEWDGDLHCFILQSRQSA